MTIVEFRRTGLASNINDIHRFEYVVSFQSIPNLMEPETRAELISSMSMLINDSLARSGIHNLNNLSVSYVADDNKIRYTFSHDRYRFHIDIAANRFSINRFDSSFDGFLEWYRRFMPSAGSLFEAFSQEVKENLQRTVVATQTVFKFKFLLCEFRQGTEPKKNIDVLNQAIGAIHLFSPVDAEDGHKPSPELYRLDLTISKKEVVAGKVRNGWYLIEAPANESGRFLVAEFQLRGDDIEEFDSEGRHESTIAFDPSAIND
ncbi:MAG: hypothetical protein AAFX56_02870, partial [Pseudomonadota bacterium]